MALNPGRRLADDLLLLQAKGCKADALGKSRAESFLAAKGFTLEQWDWSERHHGLALWEGDGVLKGDDASDFLHEYAHYAVAPNYRKHRRAFGLGTEPAGIADVPQMVSDKTAAEEEAQASLLGILLEKWFGLPWTSSLSDHGWGYQGNWDNCPDFFFDLLLNKNLIDIEGRPGILPFYERLR